MNISLTARETVAAHRLAEAIIEFMAAIETGRAKRALVIPVTPTSRHSDDDAVPRHPGVRRELLSVNEAAEYLGICARNVARLTAPHGRLPCVRMGRRVCYSRLDLDAFIRAQTVRN